MRTDSIWLCAFIMVACVGLAAFSFTMPIRVSHSVGTGHDWFLPVAVLCACLGVVSAAVAVFAAAWGVLALKDARRNRAMQKPGATNHVDVVG
ncbi:MAG: hypothetical protein GY851_04480 [bacterium]|nr:hypothetical protein [bacterium]